MNINKNRFYTCGVILYAKCVAERKQEKKK